MQPELSDYGGELFFSGLVESNPSHPTPLAHGFVCLLQRLRLLGPASVHIDGVVHDHGHIIRLSGRGKDPRNVGKRRGADLLLNFLELSQGEVRRVYLPRTRVNKDGFGSV